MAFWFQPTEPSAVNNIENQENWCNDELFIVFFLFLSAHY